VTSSQAIVGRAQAIATNSPRSALHRFSTKPEEIDTAVVSKGLSNGDEELHKIVDEAGRYLGMAVANLVGILNIKYIVIAGSAASFGQALLDPIRREVNRRSLAALADETNIQITSLGPDIVILGAAALLLTHELGLP
jgi:predicted NBD/HSP70 family sugar kinase